MNYFKIVTNTIENEMSEVFSMPMLILKFIPTLTAGIFNMIYVWFWTKMNPGKINNLFFTETELNRHRIITFDTYRDVREQICKDKLSVNIEEVEVL